MKFISKHTLYVPNDEVKSPYIVRYVPWFTDKVMINVIYGDSKVLHSHLWNYFTLILWGGYRETVIKDGQLVVKNRYPGWFSFRKHSEYHYLEPIKKKAITLFIRGKNKSNSYKYLVDGKEIRDVKYWMSLGCTRKQMDDSVVVE
jgi:hypothetical protein